MCDTVVVVEPGRVLFAKNSDRDPNEAQLLDWQPRREHAPGSTLQCTWIQIPQVALTHAVLLSRPFWMWGAELGANEHGVVIGNQAVFTRARVAPSGLTGMDLVRLALERATSAREAAALVQHLVASHGQGGGCGHEHRGFRYHSSFVVADAREAFVLETAGRACHAAPVTGCEALSNALVLPGFAERHSDRLYTWASDAAARRHITRAGAERATSVADLIALLREHGTGSPAPRYSPLNGALAAPCVHAGGLAAASQTTASWVSELTPAGARHWATATSAPCTALFKPVRVGEPLALGAETTDRYDPAALWWRHERLHRRVMRDPDACARLFTPERDLVEGGWLAAPPDSAAAFAQADRLLAEWTAAVEAVALRDPRPAWLRRYWAVRNRRAGLTSA
jgi:secernin